MPESGLGGSLMCNLYSYQLKTGNFGCQSLGLQRNVQLLIRGLDRDLDNLKDVFEKSKTHFYNNQPDNCPF